jgi:ribosomal protein L29
MEIKAFKEIKTFGKEKLIEELQQAQKRLVELKFKKSVDSITDTSEFRKLRKYIARIQTLLNSEKK